MIKKIGNILNLRKQNGLKKKNATKVHESRRYYFCKKKKMVVGSLNNIQKLMEE